MTVDEIIELLELEPLPIEGGLWAQTWINRSGSAIYYMMRQGDFSALHSLTGTELWHFYWGDPVEMLLLHPTTGDHTIEILGTDFEADQRPFKPVYPGTWMGARSLGDVSLVGTTMAPPYNDSSFTLGTEATLVEQFPTAAALIPQFVRKAD